MVLNLIHLWACNFHYAWPYWYLKFNVWININKIMSTGKSLSEVCITKGAMSEHVKYHCVLQRFHLLNIQNKNLTLVRFFCLKVLMFKIYILKKNSFLFMYSISPDTAILCWCFHLGLLKIDICKITIVFLVNILNFNKF